MILGVYISDNTSLYCLITSAKDYITSTELDS